MRRTEERCPLCGAAGVVVEMACGAHIAHCGDCYEGDPEAPDWRHLQGIAQDEDEAVSRWLERAREYAAVDEIPPLIIPFHPTEVITDLALRIAQEAERQRGWVSYKRAGRPVLYGPAAGLSLVGEVT